MTQNCKHLVRQNDTENAEENAENSENSENRSEEKFTNWIRQNRMIEIEKDAIEWIDFR
jgi:hypothetical protein